MVCRAGVCEDVSAHKGRGRLDRRIVQKQEVGEQ